MILGECDVQPGDIEFNASRRALASGVASVGDWPIQVGSYYHFFKANGVLVFDRPAIRGMRLNVVTDTAVRFELGQSHEAGLVEIGGERRVCGFAGRVMRDLQGSSLTSQVREETVNTDDRQRSV